MTTPRTIPGWGGAYAATAAGAVHSVPRVVQYCDGRAVARPGVALASHLRSGHPYVTLSHGGRRCARRVARLVLAAHVGPLPPRHRVAYADGDPQNVALCNLSYAPRGGGQE